jgi:hypothetical protein
MSNSLTLWDPIFQTLIQIWNRGDNITSLSLFVFAKHKVHSRNQTMTCFRSSVSKNSKLHEGINFTQPVFHGSLMDADLLRYIPNELPLDSSLDSRARIATVQDDSSVSCSDAGEIMRSLAHTCQ